MTIPSPCIVGPNISSTGIVIILTPPLDDKYNSLSVFPVKTLVNMSAYFRTYLSMLVQAHMYAVPLPLSLENRDHPHRKMRYLHLTRYDQNAGEPNPLSF